MSKKERIMMVVGKGCLNPADAFSNQKLKERNYKIGDIVGVEIFKVRNPKFHRLAHQLGALVVANIEDFSAQSAHGALKRMQIEAGIACDEIALKIPNLGAVIQKIPRSLSFESMDEAEFHDTVRAFCRHIASQYWKSCTPEQIEEMAQCFVGDE